MFEIADILNILTSKRIKKIELLNDVVTGDKQSYYYKLYKGISSGRIKTDKQAASYLYHADPSDLRYQKLKSRLKKKILVSLFFLNTADSTGGDKLANTAYECTKEMALVDILLLYNVESAAIKMTRKLLNTAMPLELLPIIIKTSIILSEHAALDGNKDEFELFNAIHYKFSALARAKYNVNQQFLLLNLLKNDKKSIEPDFQLIFEQSMIEADGKNGEFLSPGLEFSTIKCRILYYQMLKQYDEVLLLSARAIDITVKEVSLDKKELPSLVIQHIHACLLAMDIKSALKAAKNYFPHFQTASKRSIQFLEYYFLLSLQAENYPLAVNIFESALFNPGYKVLEENKKQLWSIFYAYLLYTLEMNQEGDLISRTRQFPIDLEAFLQKDLLFDKKKRGINSATLIIQFLFLLKNKQLNELPEKLDQLKQYTTRYLIEGENFRSNCFIKMLELMVKKSYDYPNTTRINEKYYRRLDRTAISYDHPENELEVIPYEVLWNFVLTRLEDL
ncbi:MAG: hypothetical protein IH946_01880 [Bacteroidetes bacterium]|nr:hypothetical protein [Bacteroidota bacterium]